MSDNNVQGPLDLLATHGHEAYFGERVSILEHSLQAAHFAEQSHAPSHEIAAALLHDIGHLLHHRGEDIADHGLDTHHEEIACEYLAKWFDEAVLVPVKMHVSAKRYLCAIEPGYLAQLSESSTQSLQLQGGPMSAREAAEFLESPYAEAAVRLRRWDDEAKVENLAVPGLDHYLPHLNAASKLMTPPPIKAHVQTPTQAPTQPTHAPTRPRIQPPIQPTTPTHSQ